jgi:hypothetical protein
MTFEESWTVAERAVFDKLCQATGTVDRKSAFLGYMPDMANVWAFNSGGAGGNEQTLWSTDITTMHMQASAIGRFVSRDACQRWAMSIVKAQPWSNTTDTTPGNVAHARIRTGGLGEPTLTPLAIPGESRVALLFVLELGMEIVFNTGGRLD